MKHMRSMDQYPSVDRINYLFSYDDGILYWKSHGDGYECVTGRAAGYKVNGYTRLNIDDKVYLAHRIIWIMFHGDIADDHVIDHIDRNRSNNKIENLRMVSFSLNGHNRESNNVYKYKNRNKYLACIEIDGKRITKYFDNIEDGKEWVSKIKNDLYKNIDIKNGQYVPPLCNPSGE